MANENRISGRLFVKVDGTQYDAIGGFTYNINPVKRETELGADKPHGYKELPQVQFVEGEIRDASTLNVQAFFGITNSTMQLELANGKTILLRNAWYAGDGEIGTENANIQLRFEGLAGEEV